FDGHDVANNPVFLDAGHRARECRSGPAELLGERPLVVRVADTGDGAGRTLTNVTPARSDSASSRPSSMATRLPDDPSVAMRMRFRPSCRTSTRSIRSFGPSTSAGGLIALAGKPRRVLCSVRMPVGLP